MSDVEGDLEFYAAFEDELYKETGSINSDDDIDSELEAELYQNVHFASTFVITPSTNIQEETDNPNEDKVIASSPVQEKLDSVDGIKPVSEPPCLIDGALENGLTTKYPEVELVFSNEKKKATESKIVQIKKDAVTPVGLVQFLDGVDNGWQLHEADLTPGKKNKKEKKRRSSMHVRCFNCNERGHRTLQCTQPKKEKGCCLCGLSGHIKRECPNELCFNCHEPGHQLRQCSKARCHRGDTCRRCHAYGHFENDCPDKWRQYHHTTKQGDVIQSKMQLQQLQNKVYCYNCGAEGHFGHECLEGNPDGRFADAFPFVVMYDRFTSCSQAVNRDEKQHEQHTPSQNHHRNQHHHTPNSNHHQNHHTPNQNHHTLNENHRQDHDQHQTQHHNQKNSHREHRNSNGEQHSKRRKVEDHLGHQGQLGNQDWNYSGDNWNTMEEDANALKRWRNVDFTETPELTTSFDRDISPNQEGKGKRKRNMEEAKEMIQVTLTKADINRNKKRKRNIELEQDELEQDQQDLRTVLNTWNTAPSKKKKKNKHKNKKAKLNQDALPSYGGDAKPRPAAAPDRPSFSAKSVKNRNHRQRKKEKNAVKREAKRQRRLETQQTAQATNSRRVYYDFNGFV